MSVGGVEAPPVVYLSPQAISPLSASKEPIALALAVRPEPADKAANNATNAVKTPDQVVDKTAQIKRTAPVIAGNSSSGVQAGHVDVYV